MAHLFQQAPDDIAAPSRPEDLCGSLVFPNHTNMSSILGIPSTFRSGIEILLIRHMTRYKILPSGCTTGAWVDLLALMGLHPCIGQ